MSTKHCTFRHLKANPESVMYHISVNQEDLRKLRDPESVAQCVENGLMESKEVWRNTWKVNIVLKVFTAMEIIITFL